MKIITNNPKVASDLKEYNIQYINCDYREILEQVKKEIIEKKVLLLSHPLSGSIKPNETYYKSIMIGNNKDEYIDQESLEYIEKALEVYDKFIGNKKRPNWTNEILSDFAVVDFFLIKGAIDSGINN